MVVAYQNLAIARPCRRPHKAQNILDLTHYSNSSGMANSLSAGPDADHWDPPRPGPWGQQ